MGFGEYGLDSDWNMAVNSSLQLTVYIQPTATSFTNTTQALTLNSWNHVVATRSGTASNNFKLFVNGVGQSFSTNSTTVGVGSRNFTIGADQDGTESRLTGYISNLRVVNGYGLYTSNFTPPTTPLTAVTGTSLLTCQSNRFIDTNTQTTAKTITVNGSPSVQAFSPFNPSASWSAATYGGSGYFDGNGDYLTGASTSGQLGSGNFTFECWAYLTSKATTYPCLYNNYSSYTSGSFGVYAGASAATKYQVAINGASFPTIQSTIDIVYNQWNHIAVVRNSGVITLYINGVADGTYTTSATLNGTSGTNWIGTAGDSVTTSYINGYLSNLRTVAGTAVYTANFTPPTAPLTAITNTSLLLNYTNAGIYDATSKNDLETVGNAQISTAQSKWGGSSMAFDGTGDYLLPNVATADLYAFGSGAFTIEFWIRFNVLSGFQMVYDSRPTGTDGAYPMIYANGSAINYYVNAADRISSSALSTNTWYHVAVSRSGTSTKLFIDGTQSGSTYTDSTVYINPANRPIIGANGTNLGSSVNGYIQDLRITKGYARYTANFTAPTAAFPTL
jgi:hypothetical protein